MLPIRTGSRTGAGEETFFATLAGIAARIETVTEARYGKDWVNSTTHQSLVSIVAQ